VTDVIASPVDVDHHFGAWRRLALAPGGFFLGSVVVTVLATWGAASWPGWWLPMQLPLEAAWLVLTAVWLLRLAAAAAEGGAWRDPRWFQAPAIVLMGALVAASGLPLVARVAWTSHSLTRVVHDQDSFTDAGRLRHQCAHGLCLDTYTPRATGSGPGSSADLGIYLNVRNSVRAQALVWHPGGKPTYVPCGISGFDHVYGPWYVALTAHQICAS
jgi:hypothetical protein